MKSLARTLLDRPEIGVVLIIIVMVILFETLSGTYFTVRNMRGVFGVAPEIGIVAIGVAILMISGEFDLSVGAVFALTPMTAVVLMDAGVPALIAMILVLALAGGIGFLNATITLRFAIPSFIATLGMLFIVRSAVLLISGGMPPLIPSDLPTWLFTGWWGPIRASLFWYVGIIFLAWYLMARTNLGNWIYATGGDVQASRDLGVATDGVKTFCFVFCAVLAGFAGIIQTLRVGTALTSAGTGLELETIAAAVIGGVALRGGMGTVLGAVLGALLIRLIDNGLVMARIDANYFRGAVGVLTILAVIFNEYLRRQARMLRD